MGECVECVQSREQRHKNDLNQLIVGTHRDHSEIINHVFSFSTLNMSFPAKKITLKGNHISVKNKKNPV